MIPRALRFFLSLTALLLIVVTTHAAVFPGNASIQVTDPNSALSWNTTTNSMAVSCWFKLTIPSDVTLTEDMAILVNRTAGTSLDTHAYAIYLNYITGQIEFSSKGAASEAPKTLIAHPYLDRWYHVAVVRDGNALTAYVDGRAVFSGVNTAVGNSSTNNGVTIGGWGNAKYLRGEVQEVQIHNVVRLQDFITQYMFADVPSASFVNQMRGYYKLGFSLNTADNFKNFAAPPTVAPLTPVPDGISSVAGSIQFPETNQAGEQSTFDSRRNGGKDAIAQLSGSFSWSQVVLSRATRGLPLQVELQYSSGVALSGAGVEGFVPFVGNGLSTGWAHSFDLRLIPSNKFDPVGSDSTIGLLMPDGSLDVWDSLDGIAFFPRHGGVSR